jgi:hypothetical protein
MGSNNIIVREYLESLKEDGELDYLFPILLYLMGFRVVTTARESKGQPQYGKDIIAIGLDEDGVKKRFYFELKGHSDKDINDTVLNKKDGIIDSLKASKYTPYNDSSIPGFNELPIKYVLVHNGILKSNTRATFNGFIDELFPDGNFDRWGIYKLSDLFNDYLFSEYLFTDDQSLRLFKKTLVLLDAPQNDYRDFKRLVDIQIEKIADIKKGRAFSKFFATQNLLASVVLHYSKDNNNLEAAKQCLTYLLLKTWAWILNNNLEGKAGVKKAFSKLVAIQFRMLDLFFQQTLEVAKLENGLYAEQGGSFEEVGYPVRSFEYLNYLIYFFEARLYFPHFNRKPTTAKQNILRRKQKDLLIQLIENNDGCQRPILDYHSISILNVVLFFLQKDDLREKDLRFIRNYLFTTIENILIINTVRGRFPHVGGVIDLVKKIRRSKPKKKERGLPPSLLVTILFELVAIVNFNQAYESFSDGFKGKLNLQTAHPKFKDFNIEQLLFEKHFDQEFYVETSIDLKTTLEEFKNEIAERDFESIEYRTDKAGFPFLRKLAHIYYKNELFVDEWRGKLIKTAMYKRH